MELAGVAELMSVGFVFRFTPIKLAVTACGIYLAFIGAGWLAIMLIARASGIFGLSATRWGWTVLNTLFFLASFALAWQIVGPKFSR
jgi:hypothetical protein